MSQRGFGHDWILINQHILTALLLACLNHLTKHFAYLSIAAVEFTMKCKLNDIVEFLRIWKGRTFSFSYLEFWHPWSSLSAKELHHSFSSGTTWSVQLAFGSDKCFNCKFSNCRTGIFQGDIVYLSYLSNIYIFDLFISRRHIYIFT